MSSESNKPVWSQGEVSVFLNTREIKHGEKAGDRYEIFTHSEKQRDGTYVRTDVPAKVSGYELRNDNGGSDVAALMNMALGRDGGYEVVGQALSRNGSVYTVILAPLGIEETQQGDKTYRRLLVEAALAYTAEPKEGQQRGRIESFMVRSRNADGSLSKESDLKTYAAVRVEGTGREYNTDAKWVNITVSDMIEVREAIAKGEPFAINKGDFRLELAGLESIEKSKTPQKLVKFRATVRTKTEEKKRSEEHVAGRAR
jgi:hypothetical protein